MHMFSNIPKNIPTKGGNSRDPSSLSPDLDAWWIWVSLALFSFSELGLFFFHTENQKAHLFSEYSVVEWQDGIYCCALALPARAETFHLLWLLRKSIECWQSLEGKLKTTFFLIWKYSAPQLICVFAPDVSFISYKARGNIRINESQYFYDVERFSWESPRLSRLQPLMAETAQSDLFWFWFFSPMLSEQKTPCKFWRAFSRMQRSLPWPRAFQRLQVN